MANNSRVVRRQIRSVASECRICGGPSLYSYYGVIVCLPCKVFFRRNAEKGKESFECDFGGDCQINVNNRHVCTSCRLDKCFERGMKKEMIRPSLIKVKKRKEIELFGLIQSKKLPQYSSMNLSRLNNLILRKDESNLLSNIINCYNEYSGLALGEEYMREQNDFPLKIRFKSISIIKLYQNLLGGIELIYKKNGDFLSLSSNDRNMLIRNTMSHIGSICSNYIIYQIGLMNYGGYYDAVEILSDPSVVSDTKRMINLLDFDPNLHKLFVGILSFSTIGFTEYCDSPAICFSNMKQILEIEDRYIELAWKYLLCKSDNEQSVKCFSNLIRCIFIVHNGILRIKDRQWYSNRVDSLVQQTEQTFNINN